MSMNYSFNWYNWFKKSEESDTKQGDGKHVKTKTGKHLENDFYPLELKICERESKNNLTKHTSKTRNRVRKTSSRKSKTSLKVRKTIKKNRSHHTQPQQKDGINKLYKTETAPSSLSKNNKPNKSSKLIDTRNKNPQSGDMTAEKNSKREKHFKNKEMIQTRTENSAVRKESKKEKQYENRGVTQTRAEKIQFKNENREIVQKRTGNTQCKRENREKTLKIVELDPLFCDEVRNSVDLVAEKKLSRKEEGSLINPPFEKKLSFKPIRLVIPDSSEKPALTLFSKVWPSDNSDEKIAEQSGQIPVKSDTPIISNKLNTVNGRRKQDTTRRTKITSSDSKFKPKKKGIIEQNNHTLKFEDENGKNKVKRKINPKSNCYNNNKTEKVNSYVPSNYKRPGKNNFEYNEKSRENSTTNNKKAHFDPDDNNIDDSINFISILKEIKSLKNQLKSLSDEDLKEDNLETGTKRTGSKRKLECIEEEIVESPNTGPHVSSSDLQSTESSQTSPCEKKSPRVKSSHSTQNSTHSKSVVCDLTKITDCQRTPQLSPMNSQEPQAQTDGSPYGSIETGLDETKGFCIYQSAKCLNCNGFQKQDSNLFRNRRIFYVKSYIPASERKNKKEVLMKKRLLSSLRTHSIPIKRKLNAISSSNLRKIKYSSSKEDIFHDKKATGYDFSPFLKQSFLLTSFLGRDSSVNPFSHCSDISRCTSNTIITGEKVFSYVCSINSERKAKSESNLRFLKNPQDLTAKLQVFQTNADEGASNKSQQSSTLIVRKKRNDRRMKTKNKQKAKVIKMKAKRKQKKVEENHKDANVLQIKNLSYNNSVWKTIAIEFNDNNLNSENASPENTLQIMLSEITEYLKTKTAQLNKLNLKDGINKSESTNNGVEKINISQHASNTCQSEPFSKSAVCLAGFEMDGYSASEKSSQTSTNETPTISDINIENPFVEITRQGREIQVLHENNEENKKEIEKIKETCRVKFPWFEKVIFDILTQYQRIPADFSSTRNIEQVVYSITNFTFRKSLSNTKHEYYRYKQSKKFKIFSESNSNVIETVEKEKMIEYPSMKSNCNSIKRAKNDEAKLFTKPKMFHFTKNIRRFFSVFVGRKKH